MVYQMFFFKQLKPGFLKTLNVILSDPTEWKCPKQLKINIKM